jgi:UDP-glucose 4-epimerase
MKILVTGGAGYIGSITATALEEPGHTPIIVDSLLSGPGISRVIAFSMRAI